MQKRVSFPHMLTVVWCGMLSMSLNLLEPQDFQLLDGDDADDDITCFAYVAGRW